MLVHTILDYFSDDLPSKTLSHKRIGRNNYTGSGWSLSSFYIFLIIRRDLPMKATTKKFTRVYNSKYSVLNIYKY